MGIYDREYYRDETRGSGWFSGVAPACKTIILINVVVFLGQWLMPGFDWDNIFPASSQGILEHGRVWELVTASFYHVEPFHILINMLVLWWFGREIESIYGSAEFTRMYLTAAILSTLFWALLDYFSAFGGHTMLGASGATTAVFVLYAMYYPRREVLLFFVLPLPIWLAVVLFLGLDFYNLTRQFNGLPTAAVAFGAHLGGAAYGFLYRQFDLRWSRLFAGRRFRPRLRTVWPEARERDPVVPISPPPTRSAAGSPTVRPSLPSWSPPEQLDERLDEVLAKIAREGKAGLTEEEKLILQEASRRARDRRNSPLT